MTIYRQLSTLTTTVLFLLFLETSLSYKVAIFFPRLSNSQIIWNYRFAEVLHSSGHNVTLVEFSLPLVETRNFPLSNGIERCLFEGKTLNNVADDDVKQALASAFEVDRTPFSSHRKMVKLIGSLMLNLCEDVVRDDEFLSRLKERKFDIAFADMDELCSAGLIHAAGVPSWIWMINAPLPDYVAHISAILGYTIENMTFLQRVRNFLCWSMIPFMFKRFFVSHQTALFRKYIDPNFPELVDLAANVPLIMVNSDEFYAIPRPLPHKIIYVGGLGMKKKTVKSLTGEFKKIADRASKIIVFSFGSIANTSLMPATWKETFISSFERFPDVEFFMRYDGNDLKGKVPKNLHIFKWLPQTDLVNLEKAQALITHAGYNSLQEAINSGTPIVAIPLFGDQPINAKLVAKHRFGISLEKSEIDTKTVTNAIGEILTDDNYRRSISRIREMIEDRPYTSEELLVQWTAFTAKYKNLSNLAPHSVKLTSMGDYCIDTVLFLVVLLCLFVYMMHWE